MKKIENRCSKGPHPHQQAEFTGQPERRTAIKMPGDRMLLLSQTWGFLSCQACTSRWFQSGPNIVTEQYCYPCVLHLLCTVGPQDMNMRNLQYITWQTPEAETEEISGEIMFIALLLTLLPIPTEALGLCYSHINPKQILVSLSYPQHNPSSCHTNPPPPAMWTCRCEMTTGTWKQKKVTLWMTLEFLRV